MLGSIYRFLGWLVLPAAVIIAVILFMPFAASFGVWALLRPDTAFLVLFLIVGAIYVAKALRAVRTLYGLATKKRRARDAGLAAVEAALGQRTVVR